MLQQTQVATVVPYYQRFLRDLPTIESLAAADESAVLRLWEGLGYYRRARQLHRAARIIVEQHDGEFPRSAQVARKLPGIGQYTAAAILSIAHNQREPVLEANTIRLYSRLLAFRGDPRSTAGKRLLVEAAASWLPRSRAGQFNQAVMELGSTICTPREPSCGDCPVNDLCVARDEGLVEEIPIPARRPKIEEVRETALVLRRRRRYLLYQRADDERWAGMWDFPRLTGDAGSTPTKSTRRANCVSAVVDQLGIRPKSVEQLTTLRHGVTRYRITLEVLLVELPATGAPKFANGRGKRNQSHVLGLERGRWFAVDELGELPLPVTARRIAKLLLAQQQGVQTHTNNR